MTVIISKDQPSVKYLRDKTPIKTGKIKAFINHQYSADYLEGENRRILIGSFLVIKHNADQPFKWFLFNRNL